MPAATSVEHDWKFLPSDAQSNVTQGRVICRLVSMFESVDELIEENDRRRTLEVETEPDNDNVLESTSEYYFIPVKTLLYLCFISGSLGSIEDMNYFCATSLV
jgi:hypothetical protein